MHTLSALHPPTHGEAVELEVRDEEDDVEEAGAERAVTADVPTTAGGELEPRGGLFDETWGVPGREVGEVEDVNGNVVPPAGNDEPVEADAERGEQPFAKWYTLAE